MKRLNTYLFAALVIAVFALTGCGAKKVVSPTPVPFGKGSLAVAGFTQPTNSWELLAGYLPEGHAQVAPEILQQLDAALGAALRQRGTTAYVSPAMVRQCEEIVSAEENSQSRNSAWKHWLSVGRCQATDYLLIPQLISWTERDGGEYGTLEPAAVVLDLYLLNLETGKLEGRYHFDETQYALLENLLEAGKYFKRSGKWISARQLAEEGIVEGLGELGL
ncbi:MAG: hypothetical protein ACNI27_12200 [Desulfovibrio sp.]